MSEEYGNDIVSVLDDEGNEHQFELLDAIETDEGRYVALLPIYSEAESAIEDDGELVILEVVNDQGDAKLVKFHWNPVAGTHSQVWDEAVKVSGADPDFHQGIAEIDGFQPVELVEGLFADFGDFPVQHHMLNVVHVLNPGAAVVHFTLAGDGQRIAVQGPAEVFTAAAVGNVAAVQNGFVRESHRCQRTNQQQGCQQTSQDTFLHKQQFLSFQKVRMTVLY